MRDNPILSILKIAAFAALAGMVGIKSCQDTKQEERLERVDRALSAVKDSVSGMQSRQTLTGRKITDALKKNTKALNRLANQIGEMTAKGVRVVDGSGAPGTAPTKTPDGADTKAAEVPDHLGADAKKLWGRYKSFLKDDPNWPKNADPSDPKVDPSGRFVGWYGSRPPDVNPLTRSDGLMTRYVRNYCEEYWAWPHSQNPYHYKGGLAERIEISPDYKEWVFFIRPGIRWHTPQVDLDKYPHLKGEQFLTAHDWKFTLDLIMHPDVRSAHFRSYFKGFESCEVVDDHCFIMRWKESYYNSIEASTNLVAPIPKFVFSKDENGTTYPESQLYSRFNDHWFSKAFHFVGAGPYFVGEFSDKQLITQRFNDYFGELPAIKEMEWQVFPNRDLAYTKLEKGELSSTSLLPNIWKKRVRDQKSADSPYKKMGEYWGWSIQYSFIAWNNTHPIFKNAKVRRAMTHACNRQRILNTLRLGRGVVVTGPQYVNGPVCPKDIKPLAFDLDKARAILKAEGWADRDGNGVLEKTIDGVETEFRFGALIPNNEEFKAVFEIFKEDLVKIGCVLTIEATAWAQMVLRLNDRKFDVTSLLWSTTGWDSDLGQIWHSDQVDEPESSNFISFADKEVDRLIDLARKTFDPAKRVEIQSAAHRRIHELQPYTFLNTIQLPIMYWPDRIAPYKLADRWKSRPFARYFPLWVPASK